MTVTPEQIQAAGKASVEALLGLASTQFAAFEKFTRLNGDSLKVAFEDTLAHARALSASQDAQEVATLQASFAQPALERALTWSKSMVEALAEANAELSQAAERRAAEWNQSLAALLDEAAKNAPAGSGLAVAAARQAFAAHRSTLDMFSRAAQQAALIAQANVAAAAETLKNLAPRAQG